MKSSCMSIVNTMAQEDQDALLSRLDQYIDMGVTPEQAQRMAAQDVMKEIQGEQADFMRAVREQHPEPAIDPDSLPAFSARDLSAAKEAGFDTETTWYHGTTAKDFKGFKPGKKGIDELGTGIYLTTQPMYAEAWAGRPSDEGRIIPALLKKGDLFELSKIDSRGIQQEQMDLVWLPLAKRLKEQAAPLSAEASMTTPGEALWRTWLDVEDKRLAQHLRDSQKHGGLNTWLARANYIGATHQHSQIPGQVVVFEAKHLRSPWAKFNPKKAESSNLLHSKRDFSMAGAKLVDDNGDAIPVYHAGSFTGKGDIHADKYRAFWVSPNLEFVGKGFKRNGYTTELHTNIKNPADLDAMAAELLPIYNADKEMLGNNPDAAWTEEDGDIDGVAYLLANSPDVLDYLRTKDYDSVTTEEMPGIQTYGILDADQLKVINTDVRHSKRITDAPEFKKWFGDSKVVDAEGQPLVVYRGEHGETADGSPQTLLGTYTFTRDPKIASTYAQEPNDRRVTPDAPRVMAAYLSIQNPVISNNSDPFIDFSELEKKLGRTLTEKFARKHTGHIENTGNWEENFSGEFRDVSSLLDAQPEALSRLYMDAYPLLDDHAFVMAAKDAGYDGAMHVGNGESASEMEYRVFDSTQIKSAIGNNGNFDGGDANINHSKRAMDDYLAARNKGLTKVTPQSVLDHDVALATQAIEAAVKEIQTGNYRQLSVPIGPVPHVLRMLGAPTQMLKADAGIIKKILVDKHSEDFSEVSAREFVMAIYRPALVLKGDVDGEFELISNIITPNGPIMFVIKQDVALQDEKTKVATIMSAYARQVGGNGKTIAKRVLGGRLAYADMLTAQEAVTGQKNNVRPDGINAGRAQFRPAPPLAGQKTNDPTTELVGRNTEAMQLESTDGGHNSANLDQSTTSERTLPASEQLVKPLNSNYAGWRVLKEAIVGGIAERKVKDDLTLLGWIGKNYNPKTSVKGWEDAPAFSKRKEERADVKQTAYNTDAGSKLNLTALSVPRTDSESSLEEIGDERSRTQYDPSEITLSPGKHRILHGTITLRDSGEGGGSLTLDRLEVDPAYRKQGEAGKIIQAVVAAAQKSGTPVFTQLAPDDKSPAVIDGLRSAFMKAGFKPLEIYGEVYRNDLEFNPSSGKNQKGAKGFDAWFGSSKVVDSNGVPLVVYHGTNAKFKTFSTRKHGSASGNTGFFGRGFYATADESVANAYADQPTGRVMPLFMRIENPLRIGDAITQEVADALNEAMEIDDVFEAGDTWKMVKDGLTMTFNTDPGTADNFSSNLEGMGYDGVILLDFREVVTFNANQIKSTDNNGKFDNGDNNINHSKRAGPRELKYEHNYLVPEMDGAFDDNTGNIAHMPEIRFQADGVSRTLPAMPVRIRVGEHEREGSDVTSQYGLQHRIENEQLHQNRGYVTPDLGRGSAAQVEQATRDIVAGVLGAKTAYADTVAGKIYIHAPGQNRMTVLQRKTDSEGEGFWSVVTSMPQTREQMMRKFKAPTTISGIALDGNRSQQSVTIARGILDKLQEPGLFPSSAESYILDEDGRLYNDPVVSMPIANDAKPAVTISKDANGKLILNRVQHSIRAGTSAWDMEQPSRFDDFVYKAQNKMIDVKRVIESIGKTVGTVTDDLNVYLQEELFHGRAAKRTADFGQQELQPLMEQIKRDGYTLGDVEEYLHARHAREANAVIAGREASMPDGGSGMTNGAATAYLGLLSAEDTRKLDALASQVDTIISKTRQLYADYGLESQTTVDSWGQMFQHYVPLQREDKTGSMGIGQGFSVKGKETKGRTGSTRKVVDIIANIAMQRERLIVRGEKNRVSQALVGLALANPNPDFWTVGAPPTERVYDPKTNTVVDRADPMYKSRENVLVAKVKRANGEVEEVAVNFNEEDPRALRMAIALKNLDAGNLEGLLGVSAKITRYFSAINTQYNPIFGVINLIRDVQSAMLNLDTTPLAGKKGRIAKDTISALSGIYQDMRAARQGRQPTSAWAALWDEFQEQGGQTGFRQLFATSQDRADGLQSILTPQGWMDSGMGKLFTANGALKVPLTVAQKGAGALFNWLSDYNESMENGVRLAAYKAGLDQGMSKMQAASLAKNLTVNFNRKGQVGQQAGAVYAFFNAAMQGSARIGQTLFTMQGGNLKSVRLSSTGKKVVYGGLLLGSMQALALAAAGFDDEDPPEFVRERSLIIPTGGKSYVTIPMPLGFNVIPGLGRSLTEFALSGFKAPAKRVVSIMGMFAGNFNPIGNAGMSMQTLAPTALDPLIALTENRDFTGKPIARTSSNKALPGSSQYKDTASTIGKLLSEGINGLTGGNAYVAGALSPTPDQIDYLIGQVTGGVGRELSKVEQSALGVYRGEEVPLNKIPLLGRFVGNAASQASQGGTFYSNVNKLNELETEVKGLRKDGKNQEANELMRSRPDAYLITQANVAERQLQRLRREKRELVEKNAGREVVKAKEEQMTQVMSRLNQAAEKMRATAE